MFDENSFIDAVCTLKLQVINPNYLKLVSVIFYHIFIFLPNDSPSKTVKNIFYFV